MATLSSNTHLFTTTGPENTRKTLELGRVRMDELGISTVLVATTSGAAGCLAVDVFQNRHLVCVSHVAGFRVPNTQELTTENRTIIESAGVPILTAQHAFAGINRAIRGKFATYEINEIMANTLRLFGEGLKVAVEISLMAADAGLVRTDTPLLAIAGTASGADTAVILLPTNGHTFFDLKIIEIVCMPSPFHPAAAVNKV